MEQVKQWEVSLTDPEFSACLQLLEDIARLQPANADHYRRIYHYLKNQYEDDRTVWYEKAERWRDRWPDRVEPR